MHEAVFKNRLRHFRRALRNRIERHELRLHIRRKTWVFGGAKVLRFQVTIGRCFAVHANAVGLHIDCRACIAQFVDNSVQVIATGMAQKYIAAGCGDGTQKCSRLDAVSHYAVATAMQFFNALDANAAGTVTFDLGAHGNQHLGQVWNFRFLGSVFQNGFAFCQSSSH